MAQWGGLALQQGHHLLRLLVGLRQHRCGSLLNNLRFGKLRCCQRVVRVHDGTARLCSVRGDVRNVVSCEFHLVYASTNGSALNVDFFQGTPDGRDGRRRAGSRTDATAVQTQNGSMHGTDRYANGLTTGLTHLVGERSRTPTTGTEQQVLIVPLCLRGDFGYLRTQCFIFQ